MTDIINNRNSFLLPVSAQHLSCKIEIDRVKFSLKTHFFVEGSPNLLHFPGISIDVTVFQLRAKVCWRQNSRLIVCCMLLKASAFAG